MKTNSLVVVVALTLVGCFGRTLGTNAKIARFQGQAFSYCEVRLGWTGQQLYAECGGPNASFARSASNGQKCIAYRNVGHAFVTSNAGAPWVVVCLAPTEHYDRQTRKNSNVDTVIAVFGVSQIPGPPVAPR